MKMSPNEEKISLIKYSETETDCKITKRNELTNSETLKNHEATIQKNDESATKIEYVPRIRWLDFSAQLFIHASAVYGVYLIFYTSEIAYIVMGSHSYVQLHKLCKLFVMVYTSGFGITAGVHRLWSHKAYKAKWPLSLLLMFLFTMTGQRDAYTWALDHRVHHKYSETDADPHDVRRGFFFAHVGWLFITPHPDVVAKRKMVDMSDLEADPIVMWQKRLYIPLFALLTIALPVSIPYYFWSESLWISFWMNFLRFCINLNIAFCVNSVAHTWGQKPYDKNISPVENVAVSIAALGEGYHNYHHVFPWDYKTSELGDYTTNLSTAFINLFARIGWAYDLKYVSPSMIRRRVHRCGDGSHIWGYGDIDISKEDLTELDMMNNHEL